MKTVLLNNPLPYDITWECSLEGFEPSYTATSEKIGEYPEPVALRLKQLIIDNIINHRNIGIVDQSELDKIEKEVEIQI